jgi:hypothetical protein
MSGFTTFDVWDQSLLTDIIRKPAAGRAPGAAEDTSPLLGEQIAPLKTHPGRSAKVRVAEILPFGKGQFRSPDATPPLFKPAVQWEERIISLALLDEMEALAEEEWMQLNSADEMIRRAAGASLVDRGRILQLRNERATEWLRWQAFSGGVTIPYDGGKSTLYVSYALSAGHTPVASVLWSDTANADPVSDVQAWSDVIAADTGFYGSKLHMNLKTYNYLINNASIRNQVNFYSNGANSILRPRRQDILELFQSVYTGFEIVIYDNGYREVGESGVGTTSLTKYLPDGYVLMTTDYTIDGTNIADTLDGQVSVGAGYNSVSIRQGFQTEVMLDHISKTHFLRAASARIPRLLVPDAFVWARVA